MYQYSDTSFYWIMFFVLASLLVLDRFRFSLSAKFLIALPPLVALAALSAITWDQFDIATYQRIYERSVQLPQSWSFDMSPEYGFLALNYVSFQLLGLGFEEFRFYYSLLVLIIVFFAVSIFTRRQFTYFLLYYPKFYLVGLISHVRSAFVYPFLYVSVHLSIRRKYKTLFIMCLVLSQVHSSALLFMIVPLVRYIRVSPVSVVFVVVGSVVFSTTLGPFLSENYLSQLDFRQAQYFLYEGERDLSLFGFEFLRRLVLAGMCFYILKGDRNLSEGDALFVKLFLLSFFISIGFYESRFVSDRVGALFGFSEPMLLIIFIKCHAKSINNLLAFLIVFSYAVSDFLARALILDVLPGHF
jgi:hypothetical protein